MDAGVAPIDIETRKIKEEMKLKEAQTRAVAEHGELALITVDGPQAASQERVALRPPMLQVHSLLCQHKKLYVTSSLLQGIHSYLDLAKNYLTHTWFICTLELALSFISNIITSIK